jgi:hypothetical protein
LYILAIVLAVAWLLGYTAFGVTSSLLHLILVAAVVVLVLQFVSGRRTV